ncbi:multiprotein-bridging factor 1 family protein [Actinomadura sp. SCN-SB]|uniref:helix-turn-helix domain-containing protein n=1 Tax=Actinomadura sp. SCN-SB TaxID=3373092 RepID=UPI00375261AE
MTKPERPTPSDVVGARVREVRKRRGWTAAQLAARCTEAGAPEITASVVTDLETGRRDKTTGRRRRNITVDELLALALALDVAPVHLLAPLKEGAYWVTPGRAVKVGLLRHWIRGHEPLSDKTDRRTFFGEVPEQEWQPPPPPDAEAMRQFMEFVRSQQDGA